MSIVTNSDIYASSSKRHSRRTVSPPGRVEAGQLLGLVGNTSNAHTTPSHLHFGISHPTYP
ncbi:MAG: peptidoglycan DD-metalloendopeptidase family protein [Chloroflexi bacterium]|nr:peptidoglycan DD-metalloendopeptidase family protein [Chloroflexota bacterium]